MRDGCFFVSAIRAFLHEIAARHEVESVKMSFILEICFCLLYS